jgi:hypothetical protein
MIIMKSKKLENRKMESIRKIYESEKEIIKINLMENKVEQKKIQELQNKIIGQRSSIGLTKGVTHDIRKRQFIRKGILGLIAGIGIAAFSKITGAVQNVNFADETSQAAAAPSQADQAALEAETDEDTYVAPDLIKYARGVTKCYGAHAAGGGAQGLTYNLTSTAKDSTGIYTITIATDLTDGTYTSFCTSRNRDQFSSVDSHAAGTFKTYGEWTSDQNAVDTVIHFAIFGDFT